MPEPAVEQYREIQRNVWDAGSFDEVAQRFSWAEGPVAVEAAAIRAGDEVADLACGSGNVAIRAAEAGAQVTGLDIAPELLATARKRAAEVGVEIEFVEGDASALPFADASFDAVTSVFGIQFAPRQEDVASEIARIMRPGARLALINWTPAGFVGQVMKTMSGHTPEPPEFVQPPPTWGVPEHVAGLFEGSGIELEHTVGHVRFSFDTAAQWADFMAEFYGPIVIAKRALGEQGRWEAARAEVIEVAERFSSESERLELDAEYLITTGTKVS